MVNMAGVPESQERRERHSDRKRMDTTSILKIIRMPGSAQEDLAQIRRLHEERGHSTFRRSPW